MSTLKGKKLNDNNKNNASNMTKFLKESIKMKSNSKLTSKSPIHSLQNNETQNGGHSLNDYSSMRSKESAVNQTKEVCAELEKDSSNRAWNSRRIELLQKQVLKIRQKNKSIE